MQSELRIDRAHRSPASPVKRSGTGLVDRLLPVIGIAAFLVAWGAAVAVTPHTMVPGPIAVFKALGEIAIDGVLFEHMAASLFRVALGYLAAVVVALPVGLALGWWKHAEKAVNPIIQIFRPISPL